MIRAGKDLLHHDGDESNRHDASGEPPGVLAYVVFEE